MVSGCHDCLDRRSDEARLRDPDGINDLPSCHFRTMEKALNFPPPFPFFPCFLFSKTVQKKENVFFRDKCVLLLARKLACKCVLILALIYFMLALSTF